MLPFFIQPANTVKQQSRTVVLLALLALGLAGFGPCLFWATVTTKEDLIGVNT